MSADLHRYQSLCQQVCRGQAGVRIILTQIEAEETLTNTVANHGLLGNILEMLKATNDLENTMFVTVELLNKTYMINSKIGTNASSRMW